MDGLSETSIPPLENSAESLNEQIKILESKLDIESDYDRQLEASLFIDKIFLNYSIITGVVERPERIFGDDAWADYLEGRIYARNYGKTDLTPDFICNLHASLTQRSNPKIAGRIRSVGVIGASYEDGSKPVRYTQEQIHAIEQNPLLSFRRDPPEDETSTTGFIVYPHLNSGVETQAEIKKSLAELCDWFNTRKKQGTYNPHELAGLLQNKLISLHPFLDGNGRLSRVLMNWSLENDGQPPSFIDNPGEDILTDINTWISYIEKGSQQYKTIKDRKAALEQAGIHTTNALFNLGQDKAFYEYIFRYLKQAPPLPTNGDKHNHHVYEQFLADFREEMGKFQEYMRLTKTIDKREVSQGGLITPEFLEFASSTHTQELPEEVRNLFFTDVEAYRGAMIDEQIDEEKLCQMFLNYTGVGTGYRALSGLSLQPTSGKRVDQKAIKESMDYYNRMFASSYFVSKHSNIQNPYARDTTPVRDLNTTVKEHTLGGTSIWNSPFASTSLNYQESKSWANRFSAVYAKNARHGVLFKTHLPREGMVMTYGQKPEGLTASGFHHEYEALIAGGLQPASIFEIEVYNKDNSGNPSLKATRVESEGTITINIEDRRDEFVVRKRYTYNPNITRFEKVSSETTDILSTQPIEKPPVFDPDGVTIHNISFKNIFIKEYNSPFYIKKDKPIELYSLSYPKFKKDYGDKNTISSLLKHLIFKEEIENKLENPLKLDDYIKILLIKDLNKKPEYSYPKNINED